MVVGRRFRRKFTVIVQQWIVHVSEIVSEVGRRRVTVLPVSAEPEVVSSVEAVADRHIQCMGVE